MANENALPVPYQAPGQIRVSGKRPEKILLYAMGAGVIIGAGFLVREYLVSRKDAAFNFPDNGNNKNVNLIPKKTTPRTNGSSSQDSVFPLKKGSKGVKVMQLQQGLAKLLGDDKLSLYGGIDGKFGPGTENALRAAGFSTVVDEVIFSKITGNNASGNAKSIAQQIYDAASSGNLASTLAALKKIGNVQEYTVADEQYKTITKARGLVRKTIVNDLLSYAFEGNEDAKDQIKEEFFRIGLKLDPSSGKWSLSGINPPGTILTLVPTFIIDAGGKALLVGRNVILGRRIQVKNGFTWFKSIDNTVAAVPSSDIKYL